MKKTIVTSLLAQSHAHKRTDRREILAAVFCTLVPIENESNSKTQATSICETWDFSVRVFLFT